MRVIATYTVAIDITRAANAPRAKGSVRIADVASGELIDVTDVGVLQTTKNWASLTGIARVRPSGDMPSVTIIVEDADPFVDRRPRTVTIDIDGRPRITGVLQ